MDNTFLQAEIDCCSFTDPITPDEDSYSVPGYTTTSSLVSEICSFPDDNELSEATLKYINQILMEENKEEKLSTFVHPLLLQATEKTFYDILGETYPYSPDDQLLPFIGRNDEFSDNVFYLRSTNHDSIMSLNTGISFADESVGNFGQFHSAFRPPANRLYSNPQPSLHISFTPSGSQTNFDNPMMGSCSITDSNSGFLFGRESGEATKFRGNNEIEVDLPTSMMGEETQTLRIVDKDERNKRRGRENPEGNISLDEERSQKQYAADEREGELSEIFDRVLLSSDEGVADGGIEAMKSSKSSQRLKGKQRNPRNQGKREIVDLRKLLNLCAEAVSSNNHMTANELLKQIRQNASPSGDGIQRLSHFFADALEARLTGTVPRTQNYYTSLASRKTSDSDRLKRYQFHLTSFPFKRFSIMFSNKMIVDAAKKGKALHIIDFGIIHGFQWPILIQELSKRAGRPPTLHITGIDFPQPGFRPTEKIETAGRHLANYCKRFNVPFRFDAIASQKWETIKVEDLKIDEDEVVAVNCMFQLKNLLDETVDPNSPRNAVLNLIRKIKPDIFVHSIINGSYDSPYFLTRFRETLLHFLAFFDMYDSIISRENEVRMMFERELFGGMIMNVLACEGSERIERPETYKQWQIRTEKAGFKQLPLDRELTNKFRAMLKAYHKDFAVDEDMEWMIIQWKGRTTHAFSCWVPESKSCRTSYS